MTPILPGNIRPLSSSGLTPNPLYSGELTEFDVIEFDYQPRLTDAEVQKAIQTTVPMKLPEKAPILLIQSGATMPDQAMVDAMSNHFQISVFSGVPEQRPEHYNPGGNGYSPRLSYAKKIRYAAARGGHQAIVVYWGAIEAARQSLVGKGISWIPIFGWYVPDEVQHMRLRLKIVIVHVGTGNWEAFQPSAVYDSRSSSSLSRMVRDQLQVEQIKARAYEQASQEIRERMTGVFTE